MNIKSEYDTLIKILVLGDQNVGKTKFIERFITDKYSEISKATTNIDLVQKKMTVDNYQICCQLWDTVGQEKYHSISKSLYSKVHGIILVFDVTCRESFENLSKWIEDIRNSCLRMPIIIIAHKCDLLNERKVIKKEIDEFCEKNKLNYYESSSKNNINISKVVVEFVEYILKFNRNNNSSDASFNLSKNDFYAESGQNCCN